MSAPHSAGAGPEAPHREPPPEQIEAIRLRHPWRTVFAVVLAIIAALFIYDTAVNRPVYNWAEVGKYLFDVRILSGAGYALQLTVYSMVIAIVLGVAVAVMRQSPNPVVKAVAWLYLWLFRGTPVYVQLTFWGLIPTIYKSIELGIPFTEAVVSLNTRDLLSYFTLAVIGLALNEAAYMAEIVRAGLLSVDKGQDEAATALGLGWWHTMTRVILPQAMRVIIPPTGNEVISMLKTTSLVTAVPFTLDLYGRARDISAVTYQPVPMLIVASIWYLLVTSILMVGQYFLEKHFAKGVARRPDVMKPTVATEAIGVVTAEEAAQHPTYPSRGGESIVPPHERPGGGGA
ncbi:amino acid ABC transporter permease [Leucobacter allii]|uniref:Amino acid ABC transporter permease n=1 Tax=Leucobacter allii TaxID=2932247 RepID=A0ABY4FLK9_9MICO|nr:amino acid ABC transporter permease [Leucobacter allii]UOQ57155.1 amino acid ABC transporter permease [Leucobacter allii]UOR01661.1 amino acid ABC transporter permease [Leucobacter allii]